MDHSYHRFKLCNCLDGFYNTSTACLPCPGNAHCTGYPTLTDTNTIVPHRGTADAVTLFMHLMCVIGYYLSNVTVLSEDIYADDYVSSTSTSTSARK